jgi:small subunit ribosomal protein S18
MNTMDEPTTTPAQAENTPAAPNTERTAAPPTRVRNDEEDNGHGPRKPSFATGKDARGRGRRRRKVSYLTINKIATVDYKDSALLRRFINDQGKILPPRQTGTTAKEQRMVSNAIKRAREMALMPFVALDTSTGERGRFDRRSGPRGHRPDSRPQGPRPAPAESEAAAPTRSTEPQTPSAE